MITRNGFSWSVDFDDVLSLLMNVNADGTGSHTDVYDLCNIIIIKGNKNSIVMSDSALFGTEMCLLAIVFHK